jgi:ABC-type multidrug transport system fused ATPase/permease subunit
MENTKQKKKIKFFDIIAIISTIGIIALLITDFWGLMIFFLIIHPFVTIPIIILYIISFFETIISAIRKGIRKGIRSNWLKIIAHIITIVAITVFSLYHSELLKSKRILTATLKDDLFHYTLIFRENGRVENKIIGVFGYSKTFKGTYHFEGDTIIFSKKPYDENWPPDTLLIDQNQNVIFIYQDSNGQFNTKIEWLNHFKIK